MQYCNNNNIICKIDGANYGLMMFDCNKNRITCTIVNSNTGIYIERGQNNKIVGSYISACSFNGIYILTGFGNTIRSATIEKCNKNACLIAKTHNTELGFNTINNNIDGIRVTDSYGIRLAANTLEDNTGSQIYISACKTIEISDNNMTTSCYGIYLERCIDMDISGNIILVADTGISMNIISNTAIASNTISGSFIAGIHLSESSQTKIANNIIKLCSFDIIISDSKKNSIQNCKCHAKILGIYIVGSQDNIIVTNNIYTPGVGVYITGEETINNLVYKNKLDSCLKYSIYASDNTRDNFLCGNDSTNIYSSNKVMNMMKNYSTDQQFMHYINLLGVTILGDDLSSFVLSDPNRNIVIDENHSSAVDTYYQEMNIFENYEKINFS
jgi:parallel beta-helix repeat protein